MLDLGGESDRPNGTAGLRPLLDIDVVCAGIVPCQSNLPNNTIITSLRCHIERFSINLTRTGLALVLSIISAIAWRAPVNCAFSSADAVQVEKPPVLAVLSGRRATEAIFAAEKYKRAGLLATKPWDCSAKSAIAARMDRAIIVGVPACKGGG